MLPWCGTSLYALSLIPHQVNQMITSLEKMLQGQVNQYVRIVYFRSTVCGTHGEKKIVKNKQNPSRPLTQLSEYLVTKKNPSLGFVFGANLLLFNI